jgi:hypothetical protein
MHVAFLGVGLLMVMIMGGELKRTAIERESASAAVESKKERDQLLATAR